jgi:Integrase core domain
MPRCLPLLQLAHLVGLQTSSASFGFVERMNRTLLDEGFRVKGRETFYLSITEIQRDLDAFMHFYNLERSHQGYRLNGRTPAQALREALSVEALPSLEFETIDEPSIVAVETQQEEVEIESENG